MRRQNVAPCKGSHDPGLWKSRVQLKESRIPLRVELRIQKDFNLVPVIRNPRFGIQNPRLSWIPSHGAKNGPINRGSWYPWSRPSMNVYGLSYLARTKAGVVFQANNNDLDPLCFWVIAPKQIPRCFTFSLKSSGMAKIPASGVGKEFRFNSNCCLVSTLSWFVFQCLRKFPKLKTVIFQRLTHPCTKSIIKARHKLGSTNLAYQSYVMNVQKPG